MDRSQARLILGIDSQNTLNEETINDAIEEALFIETTFFMRRNFIPKLAKKRISNLELISEASKSIGFTQDQEIFEIVASGELMKYDLLKELLSAYHMLESEIKLKLSTCDNPKTAIQYYLKWINDFTSFAKRYIYLFDELKISNLPDLADIRMTDSVEFNQLLSELDKGSYSNLVWREYNRLRLLAT